MKQHQPNQHRSSWSTSQRNLLSGVFIGLLFSADGFALAVVVIAMPECSFFQSRYGQVTTAWMPVDRMIANHRMSVLHVC